MPGTDSAPLQSRSPTDLLEVAILIPILNEGGTLKATLTSLIEQDYPENLMEVLLIDGGSSDNWRDFLPILQKAGIRHQILDNPRQSTSAGVNLGLKATSANVIVWLSGHAIPEPAYVSKLVATFTAHKDVAVGGWLQSIGDGLVGTLNALVLRSPFGTGLATWRTKPQAGWAGSATYAIYDRKTLIEAGGLDERLIRNQDTELVHRLRGLGLRFYVADARVQYVATPSLWRFLTKAWGNGAWAIWSWRLGRRCFSKFHLIPGMAVLVGSVLAMLAFSSALAMYVLVALTGIYVALALLAAIVTSFAAGKLILSPLLLLWFALHHTAYGFGTLWAVFAPVPMGHRSN